MSKTGKLQRRLKSLEDELCGMRMKEFTTGAAGRHSRLLSRKTSRLFDGKRWRTGEPVPAIEKLEKDIVALRRKLGEPPTEDPVSILREFVSSWESSKDWYVWDVSRRRRCEEALGRLKAFAGARIHASTAPPPRGLGYEGLQDPRQFL